MQLKTVKKENYEEQASPPTGMAQRTRGSGGHEPNGDIQHNETLENE